MLEIETEIVAAIDTSKIDALIQGIQGNQAFAHIQLEDQIQFGLLLCARLRFGPFAASSEE